MNKLFIALLLTVISSIFVSAQNPDYRKGEFYVGYSNGQVDTGIDSNSNTLTGVLRDRANFNGFEVSGVYNVHRYVGLKADVSATYNSNRYSFPITTGTTTQTVSFEGKNSLYNVLGGIQIKDNSTEGRFKPFVHALIGAGHGRTKVRNVQCTSTVSIACGELSDASETGFAGAFGGGLDIKLSNKVDLRAFQVDYNPIKFDAGTDHNIRFGIGFVFH
jgi:hypothetical protein